MTKATAAAAVAHLLVAASVYSQQTPQKATAAPSGVCTDSEGGAYSPGAMVPIRGQLMRCVIGPHWVPFDPSAAVDPSAASNAAVLDVTGVDLEAPEEARILEALRRAPLPKLSCDAVLNSAADASDLLRAPRGQRVVIVFWSPTCGPCKPLLAEVVRRAASKAPDLSFLSVVQAANPDVDPPGEWRLLRVKGLMTEYQVGIPTCVHSSNELARAWQAVGVPLTLLVSSERVERVASGAKHGLQLVQEVTASASSR